jgi:hypothetical protein
MKPRAASLNLRAVTYTRTALKALRKMPVDVAEGIIGKVEQYAADPASQANNTKALKGRKGVTLAAVSLNQFIKGNAQGISQLLDRFD